MIVATSEQMKAMDKKAIEEYHIPGLLLMEHAAMSVVDAVTADGLPRNVWVVCGSGNNGGDGLAVARLLFQMGSQVRVMMVGNIEHQSADAKAMYRALLGLDVPIEHMLTAEDLPELVTDGDGVIVDALFGIGCTRTLSGIYEEVVEWINESGGRVVSVDIPSGINSDNGHVMGVAVEADITVTFTAPKVGITAGPGKVAAGRLIVSAIGIPEAVLEEFTFSYEMIDRDVLRFLPERPKTGHKMTFGRLLIIAGSASMSGAGILSSLAAYRAGAGLVEIITHQKGLTAIQQAVPEAIVHTYSDATEGYAVLEKITVRLGSFDGILIGPGMSTNELAKDLLVSVLDHAKCPLVIDADGLNLLPSVLPLVDSYEAPVILTPHIGEMSRLTGHGASDILNDPFAYAEAYGKAHGVIMVLKSNATIVADGSDRYCINGLGNQGMATAGSGDVLAGVILSMIGQGAEPFIAAVLGVCIHSSAGDLKAKEKSERSLMASDIVDGITKVLSNRV